MFVLPVLDRSSIPFLRSFESLGRRSYGIYLVHFVVLNVAVALTSRLDLSGFHLIVAPTLFAIGLGVPLLFMRAMAGAAVGRRVYRYVFGIVPRSVVAPRIRKPGTLGISVANRVRTIV